MHLKNFSLIETDVYNAQYYLAPAYDLLPVQLYLTAGIEDTALALNGKKQHIRRKGFLAFSEATGIPKKSAGAMINRLIGYLPKWRELCHDSLLPVEQKDQLINLIEDRIKRISN